MPLKHHYYLFVAYEGVFTMTYLVRFKKKVDFLIQNPQNQSESFHILATEYTLILDDLNRNMNQKNYLDYFAVHELFINSMDKLIVNATENQRQALTSFKNSIIQIHRKTQKDYDKKNSFFKELSYRFCN
jgi:hypothetical protein